MVSERAKGIEPYRLRRRAATGVFSGWGAIVAPLDGGARNLGRTHAPAKGAAVAPPQAAAPRSPLRLRRRSLCYSPRTAARFFWEEEGEK